MERSVVTKRFFWCTALCLVLALCLTRGLTLGHNLFGHPDEAVFYGSAELLMEELLHGDDYEPIKPYPEGTFVFRLPFHLLAQVLPLSGDYTVNVDLWGRVSSVFYYTLGALLGLWIVADPLRGGRAGVVVYALAVCFGLFQIEQSRYGTFDPISCFVLNLEVVLCTLALRKNRMILLSAAAFVVGVAAAGKYPLAYYLILPASLLFLRKRRGKDLFGGIALLLGGMLLGFFLFSPSALRSPRAFLVKAIGDGLHGYVVGGNPEGYSTVAESALAVLVYHGAYSDLPLAGLFALLGVRALAREGDMSAERRFFTRVLPTAVLVFLVYNLLLTTFFLRTLFPYFCLCLPYAAAGLGRVWDRRRLRILPLLLCLLMVGRGAALLTLLGSGYSSGRAAAFREEIEACEGEKLLLANFFFDRGLYPLPADAKTVSYDRLYAGDFPSLEPGTAIITASLEHGMVKSCIFPPNKEMVANILRGWERFRGENGPWLRARLYPAWIYEVFGFWVHGSTATNYEFPNNQLYYRPADA